MEKGNGKGRKNVLIPLSVYEAQNMEMSNNKLEKVYFPASSSNAPAGTGSAANWRDVKEINPVMRAIVHAAASKAKTAADNETVGTEVSMGPFSVGVSGDSSGKVYGTKGISIGTGMAKPVPGIGEYVTKSFGKGSSDTTSEVGFYINTPLAAGGISKSLGDGGISYKSGVSASMPGVGVTYSETEKIYDVNDPYADYVFTKQQRNAMMDDPEGVTVYELPGGKYMVCKRDADGALRMVTPDGIYSRRIYPDKNWRHVSVEEAMRATSVTGE